MKVTKFSKHKCYFLTFSVPLITRWLIHWYYYNYAKGTRVVLGKQKLRVSHRAAWRQLKAQRIIRPLILTRFLRSEKGNTNILLLRTQRIVKLNITTQGKKLWLLALHLAKNILLSEVSEKSAPFFQVYMEFNLYLREIIFVTDVAVLTILSLNPWISFDAFEIRTKGTSA